jgi:hypothetical protein
VNLRESMVAAADDAPLSASTVDIDRIIVRERRATAARRTGLAGLALAAVLGTTLAVPTLVGGREPPHAGGADAPAGVAGLNAAELLRLASQHVTDTPVAVARGDQYVFIQIVDMPIQGRVRGKTPTGKDVIGWEPDAPMLYDEWRSVDGTHDGLGRYRPYLAPDAPWATQPIPGCRNGRKALVRGPLDQDGPIFQPRVHPAPPTPATPAADQDRDQPAADDRHRHDGPGPAGPHRPPTHSPHATRCPRLRLPPWPPAGYRRGPTPAPRPPAAAGVAAHPDAATARQASPPGPHQRDPFAYITRTTTDQGTRELIIGRP